MTWFRKHIRTGSRLALFALAVQFVMSFGHFHPLASAQAATAINAAMSQLDLDHIGTSLTADVATETSQPQLPADHDDDQHPADNCPICDVISLASDMLCAAPPVLPLPEAVALLRHAADAEFLHLRSTHSAFRSRAPPRS
ncbi:DUF2946 domain-containing protein [Bradyrhizobium jicamae]|uniref:DUF2946 family protein n=1 Tax=Bradyrhizobium jicamae TaxID=280332 RepID=UPI001BAD6D39|nr:DUF2946 domain-containing protein [Bradyrhizobium jicamae]MBR0757266.1 DUF2946 domain-containing protein [Bradyrhizobium jicamae]